MVDKITRGLMRNYLLTALTILALNEAALAEETVEEAAKLMARLAAPSYSATESTKKRFMFILPALVERCSDIDKPMYAADMLVKFFSLLDERGLGDEEGLLQASVNMHKLTATAAAYAFSVGLAPNCAELWSMYLVLRQDGWAPPEAIEGVGEVTKAFYGMAK